MKRFFLFIAGSLLTLMAANAQNDDKLVVSAGSFKNLSFGEGMKVVLVNATEEANKQGITSEVLQKLNVHFNDGTLALSARKALGEQTVYVLVNDVKSISAGENTDVQSDDVLTSQRIDLFLNAGATARLKTTGRVDASAPSDVDISVKRRLLTSSESAAATGIN